MCKKLKEVMTIKVLHINSNYTLTTLHQCMIENLEKLEDIHNEVFMATYDRSLGEISPNDNVCVCECFQKRDRVWFDYKQRKILKAIEKQFNIADFDLIHAYTLFTDGNVARILSKKYGVPYVVAVRNTDVNIFLKKMIHLRSRGVQTMLGAKNVFFLSGAYRHQVFRKYVPQRFLKELWGKSQIIPNGIDEFWFKNMPEERHTLTGKSIKLLFVGRINKNKNIPTIQKAMEILQKQGYELSLTVVGKNQDKDEFARIQAEPNTLCLPAMPKEELIKIYRSSDIFVMPSFTESFGLVYAEAMSQGLPVIYSKDQGFDCQFEEGLVGFHVVASDPKDVADKIKSVIDNYAEIQKNTIKLANVFNWPTLVEQYNQIYKMIVEK